MDLITSDESASQISDKIKDLLFSKSAERIDAFRPSIANAMFGEGDLEDDSEEEYTQEEE